MVLPYFLALLAVLLLTAVRRDPDQMKTAAALSINWLACWLYAQFGDGADWRALFSIDYTTAVLLAIWSHSRPPLVVVGIYVGQCIAHAAMGYLGSTPATTYYYLVTLSWTAWLQLAFVGVWTGGGLAGFLGRRRHPSDGSLADQPVSAPVASKDAGR